MNGTHTARPAAGPSRTTPFTTTQTAEDESPADPNPEGGGAARRSSMAPPHVLVVDDDRNVVDLEKVRLERLGYRVTTHVSGAAAVDAVTSQPDGFDVVLTDYAMPGMDGIELTKILRSHGHGLPIVVMSGFSAQISSADVHDAGAETLLKKPVATDELRDTLEGVL